METKESKVTEVRMWSGDGDQYGNMKHTIKFEDGHEGIYNGQPNKCPFVVGEEIKYNTEVKTWKSGKEYNKVTKWKPEGSFSSNSNTGKSSYNNPEETKANSYSVAQSVVKNSLLYFERKESRQVIFQLNKSVYEWIIADGLERRIDSQLRWNAMLRSSEMFDLMPPEYVLSIKDSPNFIEQLLKSLIEISNVNMKDLRESIPFPVLGSETPTSNPGGY